MHNKGASHVRTKTMEDRNFVHLILNLFYFCQQENRNKLDRPADYIQYLSTPDLSVNKMHGCIESLRIALTNNPLSWVQDFGIQGLKQVLSILNECYLK